MRTRSYSRLSRLRASGVREVPYQNDLVLTKIYKIYDGDTCSVVFYIDKTPFKIDVRVNGMDTPELSRCTDLEKEAGRKVRDYVRSKLLNKITFIRPLKWGSYGRLVADVHLLNGQLLSEDLMDRGYARYYDGKKRRSKWTTLELNTILSSN